jgi:hypothetical protein
MALTDTEALQFYDAIAARAREARLDWILGQVEEQLALGSVAPKSLPVKERSLFVAEEEVFEAKGRGRKSTKATFLVSKPYTAQERLGLLVDGLLSGIVHLNQIADEVIAFAASELKSSSVEFAPEAEVKPTFRLESGGARVAESSEKLASLLIELKREISNAG